MKIVKLVAENVKRLHAVSITPEGALVTVGGKNGAGKSSVLDSIAYALGGEKLVPSEPIRSGEAEAKIVVDLGDLVVTRKFKREKIVEEPQQGEAAALTDQPYVSWGPTSSTLTVTNRDGARYPSPQAVLDKLLGKLTFDPLAFARAEPKEQDAILRKLVGLDVAPIEARRRAAFDQRAMLKKTHAIKEAQLAALPFVKDAPAAEVPMDEVGREMLKAEELRKVAEDAQRAASKAETALGEADRSVTTVQAELTRLEKQIRELTRQQDEWTASLGKARQHVADLQKEVAARHEAAATALAAVPETEGIRLKIKNTEVMNAAVRGNQKRADAAKELAGIEGDIEIQQNAITAAEMDKKTLLFKTQFPVPGLGLGDDGVTFNGHPFEQAADNEKVRTSVAIGIALNPQLRVLLVRNGNMLDKASLAAVAAQAEASDMQLWVEMVAEDKDGVAVMMVDGEVAP